MHGGWRRRPILWGPAGLSLDIESDSQTVGQQADRHGGKTDRKGDEKLPRWHGAAASACS